MDLSRVNNSKGPAKHGLLIFPKEHSASSESEWSIEHCWFSDFDSSSFLQRSERNCSLISRSSDCKFLILSSITVFFFSKISSSITTVFVVDFKVLAEFDVGPFSLSTFDCEQTVVSSSANCKTRLERRDFYITCINIKNENKKWWTRNKPTSYDFIDSSLCSENNNHQLIWNAYLNVKIGNWKTVKVMKISKITTKPF